jgi:uncharacterized protein (DUF1330 family)
MNTIPDQHQKPVWNCTEGPMGPQVSNPFTRHGVRFHIRGGSVEMLEGSNNVRRLVVFEFPSMEVIRSVWHSPEYAEVKRLREGSGELDVWAVPGV